MKELLHLFSPNRHLAKRTFLLLCLAQGALAVLWWTFGTSPVVPKPLEIIKALGELAGDSDFFTDLATSTWLACQSVAITFVISLGLVYASVLPFFRPLAQLISKARFLSLVGLSFLFTLALSGGHGLKVSLLVFGMTVFYVTALLDVLDSIPRHEFNHARTLGLGEWGVVREVVILGRLDQAFELLRQNFAIAWMMLTMVEGISRAEGGIGALLLNQNKHLRLDSVFAIQISIFAIGILLDAVLGWARRFLFPYSVLSKGQRR